MDCENESDISYSHCTRLRRGITLDPDYYEVGYSYNEQIVLHQNH